MGFYDIPKDERVALVKEMKEELLQYLQSKQGGALRYFEDEDTYIRKACYLNIGRLYSEYPLLQKQIIALLKSLSAHPDFKVRQTVINAAGEIGKTAFDIVRPFFDAGLFDTHHSPRNAVIGSVKKMGEVNPGPVLEWAQSYLHHPDKEIRREICHGIELRGRKHPEDILPLLQALEHDKTARVRNTLVHVIGQIAYKKGCLEIVTAHLKHWVNKDLVKDALAEIIDVHYRYRNFSFYTQDEARLFIEKLF
ncbi:HEAT repeat domain-containing protein [Taibaiella lutea]|uniref:HEAT repeat domain-containing protein n=1 Tax=Taibaiella lutea TaxID=2608001 RepID=A0A5M6CIT3_9BACT|nr:HEAT repeat domain-containing protein [Taibaiella lutea]KAA5534936.1 HEAT repeat domain-containing protein [Taibaiella lutea]